jgi:hypothetical protein
VVAFATSLILGLIGCAAVVAYGKRRPVGAPISWGEAMFAATFAFLMFFWWYGVIPNQWLSWADNELNWRSDAYLMQSGGSPLDGHWPIDINKQVLRDLIAVGIYGLGLGLHVTLWVLWQDRSKERPAEIAAASRYGRPLVRKG